MFSVVIPLYNKAQSITATLNSVLAQSFVDFEIILVNDGSTDGSLDVARKIQDSRIKIINKENGGVSSARNRGIKDATYEWITFLDGDDLWTKKHLETLRNMILKYPNDKAFCTSFIRSTYTGTQKNIDEIDIIENYFVEALKSHFFWTSVACLNKSVFTKIGYFKEFLSRGEDLELWARIGREYRIIRSKEITGIYVQDAENKASFSKDKVERSIIYYLDFNRIGISKVEYLYYKKLLLKKLKSALLENDWKLILTLLKKYNFFIFLKK